MGQAWIEDDRRPGGIGRTERERVFWERVASGRRSPDKAVGGNSNRNPGGGSSENEEGRWESAQLAVVTLLTVVVFGLGWVTFELERVTGSARYDAGDHDSAAALAHAVPAYALTDAISGSNTGRMRTGSRGSD
jgi:hypothetical protein